MKYGIILATGETQLINEGSALTNALADGLLGGGAMLVTVDEHGKTTPLEGLLQQVTAWGAEEDENR